MSSMGLLSSLPNELLDAVFDLLSKSDLASISLVCHAWQNCAFPRLYHTVYISLATDLQLMVSRIKSEDETGPLSIVSYLKGLVLDNMFVLDHPGRRKINERDLIDLQTVISRLVGLEILGWDLGFVPQGCRIFELFQSECPKLAFVRIDLQSEVKYGSDEYKSLLRLTGISELSVKIYYRGTASADYAREWAPVLIASPNLVSFSIRFYASRSIGFDVSGLVAALGDQFTRPRLHTFGIHGYLDQEWESLFDQSSQIHTLWAFFKRHPNIQNLALAHSYDVDGYRSHTINPDHVAQLFPSLQRFKGPNILIRPLVFSSLAPQLKALTAGDYRLDDYWASAEGPRNHITTMPHLRELSIQAYAGDAKILLDVLNTFITAAPGLEKIEIPNLHVDGPDFVRLVQTLRRAGSLIEIDLNSSLLKYVPFSGMAALTVGENAAALELKNACPRLQVFRIEGYEVKKWGSSSRCKRTPIFGPIP
ncbi:unnamed protein product [Rhizoctonia solani]|uniref:F-box domain-containing protein n=1 Tax=Rhizoctonia solani TaxID=456999 RepID=A0A8H3AHH3_9AGAM|nr:unnamed protein product [Rhizoctonia solani]